MIRDQDLSVLLRAIAVVGAASALGVSCAYFFDVGISADGFLGRFTWNFGLVLVLFPLDVVLGAYIVRRTLFPVENGALTIWNVEHAADGDGTSPAEPSFERVHA